MVWFKDMQTVVAIGPFSVTWYATCILIGALIAYFISSRNLKKIGYDQTVIDDLFVLVLITGIVGARLWYVAFSPNIAPYLQNPISIFKIWEGGLAIQGALVAALLAAYFYLRKRRISFLRVMDLVLPNVLVAQALGRWGNFFNQEAFGRIVDASFYQGWPSWLANHMYISGAYREPTFLYESLTNIIGFFLIVFVYKKISKWRRGDLVYAYLMWYGLTRFFIEGLRSDSLVFMGFKSAQLVSIVFVVVGVLGTFGLFRKLFPDQKPVLLFDLDGTLLDTDPIIKESFLEVFKQNNMDVNLNQEQLNAFVGPTLVESFSKFVPHEQVDDFVDQYRVINKKMHDKVNPLPNALNLLQTLQKQGYRMAVVSSKAKDMIEYGLNMHRMLPYFETIVGAHEVTHHKPNKEPLIRACELMNVSQDNAVYIGDTGIDVQAATNAGMYAIAYVSNPSRLEEIKAQKPNKIINDLTEIQTILEQEQGSWTRTTT